MKKFKGKAVFVGVGIIVLLGIAGSSAAILNHVSRESGKQVTTSKTQNSSQVIKGSLQTKKSSSSDSSPKKQTTHSVQQDTVIDTKNLSDLQFKQWVAIYAGENSLDNRPERIVVFNRESDGKRVANTKITEAQVDSRNTFEVNENGELESLDFEHYPAMKVSSTNVPSIDQKKLNEKEIKYWVVAVQDAIFSSEGTDPKLDLSYGVDVRLENSLVYADVFKIDYTPNPDGGAAIANRTKVNEFRVNTDGNLEMIDKNDHSKYIIISQLFMDASLVK